MNWKRFLLFCSVAVLASSLGYSQHSDSKKPNIVFFFADDLGYGDIRVNNPESKIPTPNIDRLAGEGMRFTDAHSVGALCAPSRFGLLTGRDAASWKSYVDIESEAWDCKTMPQMLKDQGYYTAIVGKWHFGVLFEGKDGRWGYVNPVSGKFPKPVDNWKLSAPTRLGPLDRGFDYFFGTPLQPGGKWFANMEGRTLIGNVELSPDLPQSDEFVHQDWMKQITGKAKEQIKIGTSKNEPFFLYFPINAPHKPIIPDSEFRRVTGIGKYGDYVNQVDWCVGEVVKAIDEAGIADNTIFIFASDNGSYYYPGSRNSNQEDENELKENQHKANGVFKAGKGNPEEGGHRIPYIVRWPGHIEAGSVSSQLVSLADHFATFAAIAGYQLKNNEALDSWNILPIWKGEITDSDDTDRTLFHLNVNPDVTAVRHGKWKLIPACYYKPKNRANKKNKPARVLIPAQLYDLSVDPEEEANVYELHPNVVKDLKNRLDIYQKTKYNAPHVKNAKIERAAIAETVHMPDGIHVRMITLALHANKVRSKTGRWMLNDHTANDVLRYIEQLKPDCLERFITGKQDPNMLVPVDEGEKPMTVIEFLDKAVEAGSDKCIIIPKLNLKWEREYILESAQNLYDLPLKKPIRNINLDCWADIKGVWSEAEIKSLLKEIKKIGYEVIGVNMTGGYHPGHGYVDYMDFNIDTKNWQVNRNILNRLHGDRDLKRLFMYIDYPGAMDRFRAEHTTDEQADIYVERIQPFEYPLGFTFVYAVFQDDWDATKEFTSKDGKYEGKSMFEITKMLIEKTRREEAERIGQRMTNKTDKR